MLTKPAPGVFAANSSLRQGRNVYHRRLDRPMRDRGRDAEPEVSSFYGSLSLRFSSCLQSLAPTASTPAVAATVRFGPGAVVLPDAISAGLMKEADPASVPTSICKSRIKAGARVTVIVREVEVLEDMLKRETGEERAVVLFRLLVPMIPSEGSFDLACSGRLVAPLRRRGYTYVPRSKWPDAIQTRAPQGGCMPDGARARRSDMRRMFEMASP